MYVPVCRQQDEKDLCDAALAGKDGRGSLGSIFFLNSFSSNSNIQYVENMQVHVLSIHRPSHHLIAFFLLNFAQFSTYFFYVLCFKKAIIGEGKPARRNEEDPTWCEPIDARIAKQRPTAGFLCIAKLSNWKMPDMYRGRLGNSKTRLCSTSRVPADTFTSARTLKYPQVH